MLLFTLPENQLWFPVDYLKISLVKNEEVSTYMHNGILSFCLILKMSNQFPYETAAEVQFPERNIKIFKYVMDTPFKCCNP